MSTLYISDSGDGTKVQPEPKMYGEQAVSTADSIEANSIFPSSTQTIVRFTTVLNSMASRFSSSPMMPMFYANLIVVLVGGPEEVFMDPLNAGRRRQQDTVDFMQEILGNDTIWLDGDLDSKTEIRSCLRKLLARASHTFGVVPSSLLLDGVTRVSQDPVFGGSFADVYRGTYRGRKVALKRPRFFLNHTSDQKKVLKKSLYYEVLIWLSLKHPHVLPLTGIDTNVFSEIELPCMVLPWMDNGTLQKYLQTLQKREDNDSGLTESKVHRWAYEIITGVAYLHHEGIVHGDLRCDNILVDDTERVRITDFGLAVYKDGQSGHFGSERVSYNAWKSPELLDPQSTSDRPTAKSDIYSYACVCIELYTGAAPFKHKITDIRSHVLQGHRPERPKLFGGEVMDNALWQIVENCWSQLPESRPNASTVVQQVTPLVHHDDDATSELPTQILRCRASPCVTLPYQEGEVLQPQTDPFTLAQPTLRYSLNAMPLPTQTTVPPSSFNLKALPPTPEDFKLPRSRTSSSILSELRTGSPERSKSINKWNHGKSLMKKKKKVRIAVFGLTGAGKTTFINVASGSDLRIGSGLRSCTDKVQLSKPFELDGYSVTLIDTPGFDNTSESDEKILDIIRDFLSSESKYERFLNGVLYLHRISELQISETSLSSLRMFEHMCGPDAIKNCAIVTNMWNTVDFVLGELWEKRLFTHHDFFQRVRHGGAMQFRNLDNTKESAHSVIAPLLANKPVPLRIQKGLSDQQSSIASMTAGTTLLGELAELTGKREGEMRELEADLEEAKREQATKELEEAKAALAKAKEELEEETQKILASEAPVEQKVKLLKRLAGSGRTALDFVSQSRFRPKK